MFILIRGYRTVVGRFASMEAAKAHVGYPEDHWTKAEPHFPGVYFTQDGRFSIHPAEKGK